jgi:GT2 family glycosyltransferase
VVSVCIPVVSENGLIEDCLDALAASRPSVDTEVVVVANGLGDKGLSSLLKRDDITLVRSAVNAGFSGGNNLAAQFARGRYLLLLNDDSVVEGGFIDRLLSAVEREPSIAAAGGRILFPDGTLQEAGSVLWSDGLTAHVGAGLPVDSPAYQYVRYVDFISANGLLVDRDAWDAVGGLDERYFPAYCEDVDLCLALWDHGYKVAYEPRARLRHFESQSSSTAFRSFLLIRNRAQLVAKWAALLQNFADPPDPVDNAAVDEAVLRAERSIGRVLVLESSGDGTEWHQWVAVEALATAGWSVMLALLADQRQERTATERFVMDRLIDLGVDVREDRPEDLLSRYADGLEAIVVPGEGTALGLSLQRPDGSCVPLVIAPHDRDVSVVDRVAAVARRDALSSHSRARPPALALAATLDPSDNLWDPLEGLAEGDDGSPKVDTNDGGFRRDATFAEAYAEIRREYCEFLERELARTRAEFDAALGELVEAFDQKERYIDSLLSVRVKKWIVGRLPGRKS